MAVRIVAVILMMGVLGGCSSGPTGPSCWPAWQKNKELTAKNEELAKQVTTLTAENKQLTGQVQTLSGLSRDVRMANLETVDSVSLSSMSGLYAAKGEKSKLLAYLVPADVKGDAVKAAGSVDLQLWNLAAKDPNKALVAKWQVGAADLKTLWGMTFMRAYYRIEEDLPSEVTGEGDYVIRAAFTDYLTGRVFKAEKSVSGITTRK